jgi:hypothetical protein
MGRVYIADLFPGAQTRASTALTTVFNPEGDWGNARQLAHPGASTELICDFHAKRLRRLPSGDYLYDYRVTITNNGPLLSSVFVDW